MILQLRKGRKKVDYDANADPDAKWEAVKAVSKPVDGVHTFEVFSGEDLIGEFSIRSGDPDIEHSLDYRICNETLLDIYEEEAA